MARTILTLTLAVALGTAAAACKDEEETGEAQPTTAQEGATKAQPKLGSEESNPLGALAEAGKAMEQAAKAMNEAGGGMQGSGKVVNWRKLAPFLPAELSGMESKGELEGSTTALGEMQVSKVGRRYVAGERQARIEIVDTATVPMLRAGFAMAQHVNEDSTKGVKRGIKIEGQPALLDWRKSNKRGKVDVLAGERFLVTVELVPAEDPESAVKLARALDIKKLSALTPE